MITIKQNKVDRYYSPCFNLLVDENTMDLGFLKTMTSLTSNLMAIVDRKYIYRAVNFSYLEAFGRLKEEVIGHHLNEILGSQQFEDIAKPYLERAFAGEQTKFQSWIEFPRLGKPV